MALADYFHRNAQAAAALVSGFDAEMLAKKLEKHVIGIVFDDSVRTSLEAQATIDLVLRLLARLYPTLTIVSLGDVKKKHVKPLHALVKAINPKIDIESDIRKATKLLVVGRTPVTVSGKLKRHTWYLGSDNWIAGVSRNAPVGSGSSSNPLAAGAAACIGAANVFRAVFAMEVGDEALDDELCVSLIDLLPATAKSPNPPLQEVELQDVHLAGAGAIGNGTLWALSRLSCRGKLHVIDPEKVTDSNLQRYVMLTDGDQESEKVGLAATWLKGNKQLEVVPHPGDWAEHIAAVQYKADTVLSAVDSAEARIQIQASLPRVIFNGWTQKGEAGVSRHTNFLGAMACLACLYIPTGKAENEDVLVARALKLPEDRPMIEQIRRRLQHNVPTDAAFLQQIATAANLPFEKLASFENLPLRDLYVGGVCGGQVMEFHKAAIQVRAEVPMGFQSAFSGLLLAAELARPSPVAETITQVNLMGTFPNRPSRLRTKASALPCLCADEDFRAVYMEKYGVTG
ncbi:MAG: Y4jF [Ramlibacter sp.]|nr:Y4jF [Ramlibacter sp.]